MSPLGSRGTGRIRRVAGRAALTIGVVTACFGLLAFRLSDITLAEVLAAMASIPAEAVLWSLVFGLVSHLAISGYDLLAFTRIARRVPWPRALMGGFAGTVMGQVLGFGLVTGALARARVYRANEINATEAVALSGFVATGFYMGLGVLLAMLLLWDPGMGATVTGLAPATIQGAAGALLAILVTAALLCSARPLSLRAGPLTLRMPDAGWLAGCTALAVADLVPAAFCLAALLPADALPPPAAFIAIYITGVALGHLIGAPGAAGPFEGVLFLALPAVAAPDLAAGILLYRLTYYLPPFCAALVLIARAPATPRAALLSGDALRNRIAWVMDTASQAEAELVMLGDKHVYCPEDGDGFVFYGISGRVWLVMGDPVGPHRSWPAMIAGLQAEARAAGAALVAYKATAASWCVWKPLGYSVHLLGEEAALDMADWTLDSSARRELRRKFGGARKAGVTLRRHLPGEHPVTEMAEVAEAWRAAKGHEQGFSMGRWDPGFNSRHMAVSAWVQERLVAFATFWVSGDGSEWMMDLMRQRPEAPNGTMYAVTADATAFARESGARRVNLCMAPLSGLEHASPATVVSRIGRLIYSRFNHRHHLQGMRRFKDVFRPDWSPRAVMVPNAASLPEALLAAHALIRGAVDPHAHESTRSPLMIAPPYRPRPAENEPGPRAVRPAPRAVRPAA